jgi:hypothetical protein
MARSETKVVTLTGNTDVVTLSEDYHVVEVINMSGNYLVWFSIDHELDLTPNANGNYDNVFILPGTICAREYTSNVKGNTVVYVKGTLAETVAITGRRL